MNTLSHDLAWTLIHFLWQGVLIALIGNVLLGAMRRRSAATRYVTAYLTLLTMAAALLTTFVVLRTSRTLSPRSVTSTDLAAAPAFTSSTATDPLAPIPAVTALAPDTTSGATHNSRFVWPNWKRVIIGLWAGGVLLLTVWRFVGLVGIARLRRRSQSAPGALTSEFTKLRDALAASRRVVARVSDLAAVPVVIGALRPMVLIPASALTGLAPEQLRAVLAHELAHVRRHDYLANLLQTGIETLFFFHPCVWWLSATIRREREHACDDIAVDACGDRLTYARALGALAEFAPAGGHAFALAAVGRKGALLGRVSRVMRPGPAASGSGFGSALLLLIAVGIAASVAAPTADKLPEESKANTAAETGRGRILDRDGRVLAETVDGVRRYPFGSLASHTLGYVGKKRKGAPDVEGRDGVEMTGDAQLQTADLRLTLDLEMQFVAETVLRDAKISMGSVVVVDPNNGDVLAMASAASYDPNVFAPGISREDFEQLSNNPAHPLLGRGTRASYPPGSTLKPVSGLALGDATQRHRCDGALEIDGRSFRCWKRAGHGELDLAGALTQSCNCYFYQLGVDVGLDKLHTVATGFGLGQTSGIELHGERKGVIANTALLEKRGSNVAGSASLQAIGQGQVNVTPLQMAMVAATFANKGQRPAPRLFLDREPTPPIPIEGVDPDVFATVRKAMRQVVIAPDGTARRATSDKIAIAGKTGTAQWQPRERHVGWFIGFAPYEEPRYAIAIVVENAKAGGTVCAPLAKKILERFAAIDAGEKVEVKPLAPIEGHAKLIEVVE